MQQAELSCLCLPGAGGWAAGGSGGGPWGWAAEGGKEGSTGGGWLLDDIVFSAWLPTGLNADRVY